MYDEALSLGESIQQVGHGAPIFVTAGELDLLVTYGLAMMRLWRTVGGNHQTEWWLHDRKLIVDEFRAALRRAREKAKETR